MAHFFAKQKMNGAPVATMLTLWNVGWYSVSAIKQFVCLCLASFCAYILYEMKLGPAPLLTY